MPRKPAPVAQIIDPATPESTANWSESANQLAIINQERSEKIRELASTLHYSGSLHPDALEAVAIEAQRYIQAGLFALGTSLILLRESCDHGDFLGRLDRIGVEPRVAQKAMQIARRFSNAPMSTHLESLGKSKLLELIVLDDEQIEELTTTGHTGELALDDLATMSVKDLRATIRNLRGDAEATEKVLAGKQAEITKLERKLSKPGYTPDQTATELHKQMVQTVGHEMLALHGQIAKVATVVQDVYATGDTTAIDGVNEVVRWAFQSLADVALKHGIQVDFKEVVVPEWMRPMLAGATALEAAQAD